jgi:hypothetical protein
MERSHGKVGATLAAVAALALIQAQVVLAVGVQVLLETTAHPDKMRAELVIFAEPEAILHLFLMAPLVAVQQGVVTSLVRMLAGLIIYAMLGPLKTL